MVTIQRRVVQTVPSYAAGKNVVEIVNVVVVIVHTGFLTRYARKLLTVTGSVGRAINIPIGRWNTAEVITIISLAVTRFTRSGYITMLGRTLITFGITEISTSFT